jgi:hypothetical protein
MAEITTSYSQRPILVRQRSFAMLRPSADMLARKLLAFLFLGRTVAHLSSTLYSYYRRPSVQIRYYGCIRCELSKFYADSSSADPNPSLFIDYPLLPRWSSTFGFAILRLPLVHFHHQLGYVSFSHDPRLTVRKLTLSFHLNSGLHSGVCLLRSTDVKRTQP